MSKKHLGSSIDDFLKKEGIFEEAQAQAIKEVVAWQLAEAMKVRLVVITSSPGPIPRAYRASSNATVPFAKAIALVHPVKAANSCSKAVHSQASTPS